MSLDESFAPLESADETNLYYLALQGGDIAAFDWMVKRLTPMVAQLVRKRLWGVANEQDIEEITEDAFIALWNQRESIRDVGKCNHLLRVVASRLAIDFLRRALRRRKVECMGVIAPEPAVDDSGAADGMLSSTTGAALEVMIASLPRRQRACLELWREGVPRAEAAALLRISPFTFDSNVQRAFAKLRSMVRKQK